MKKFILLLFIIFLPFSVNAETCNADKITISSITAENKSDNVLELEEATANGMNINLNLSMSEVGDNIKYKVVIKNDSSEDYGFDKNSLNIHSDYINYDIETEDNSNIVKANSSKVVYLKVIYEKDVPGEKFNFGTFNDNDKMIINLSTGILPDTLKNPNTGDILIKYILVLILSIGISLIAFKTTKSIKLMILILGTAIIIPTSTFALCKCEINIESNIVIKSGNRQCSHNPRDLREFVMCELETDIYDITKKECDEIINNANSTEEEVQEAKELMESYDYLISQFDWDSYIYKTINRNNYMNYPDGIYINGIRAMSFYNGETYSDFSSYYNYLNNNNLEYNNYLPEWKENTLKEISGYSFTKPGKTDMLENLISRDDIIRTELVYDDSIDLNINSPIHITKFYKSRPIEEIEINMDAWWSLSWKKDAETGDGNYYFGEWANNPENITLSLFNWKVDLINSLIDSYVNALRGNTHIASSDGFSYYGLEELFTIGKEKGYVKYSLDEILNGEIDDKSKEILEAFGITDIKVLQLYNAADEQPYSYYYYNHSQNSDDFSWETLMEGYSRIKKYYDYVGIEYDTIYCTKNTGNGTQQIPCWCSRKYNSYIPWKNAKIVYNGKYYEGEKSIFEFMIDYYNITGDNYESKLESLYDHLFEITSY